MLRQEEKIGGGFQKKERKDTILFFFVQLLVCGESEYKRIYFYNPKYKTAFIIQLAMQKQIKDMFIPDFSAKKCGCYARKHLINGIPALVPLKHIDYVVEVVNSLMNITLSQRYTNPSDKFLEVDYAFPISPESAIYKFHAEFGNVKIEGVVKEKEEAQKEFEQAKSEGKQAVLGSIDPLSKDIMNLEIGNVPPKSEFTISISFMQEMRMSLNTFYKVQVPSTISPRYTAHALDRLQKDKQAMKEGSQVAKGDFSWSFKVEVRTTRKLIFFDSPSHDLTLISQNDNCTQTVLVMSQAAKPNKDFTFLYTTEDFHLPSYVLGKTDVSSTVMLSFIPKFCTMDINDAYKASIANKSFETEIDTAKGDYVFLLDRSGSMGGGRIQKAKEALVMFLKSLPPDSYFNVISFGSSREKMFPKSQKYSSSSLDQAIKYITPMSANLGGTEIYYPLSEVLEEQVQKGYPKHVFLLTDGGVSNTQGVLRLIKQKTKYCRVHSIGIGNGASFDLIQGSAENGKGQSIMISDAENPADKIIQLLESTLTPLIHQIDLHYDKDIVQSIHPNPESLPYILKDDLINFYVTFKAPLHKSTAFAFSYKDSITNVPYKADIEVAVDSLNEPFVDKMAHLKVIKSLEEAAKEGIKLEDQMLYVKVKDYKKEAINESVKHQVLSEYTAFLCVGKELVDGQYHEYVDKGKEKVHIEQMKPVEPEDDFLSAWNMPPKQNYQFSPKLLDEDSSLRNKPMKKVQKKQSGINSFFNNLLAPPKKAAFEEKSIPKKSQEGFNFDAQFTVPQKPQPPQQQQQQPINFSNFQFQDELLSLPMQPKIQKFQNKQINLLDECLDSNEQQPSIKNQDQFFFEFPKQKIQKEQVEDRKRKESPKQSSTKFSIEQVVSLQDIDGSWKDKNLVGLSSNAEKVKQMMNAINADIVITYLVTLWIQKYHTQKQYTLLVKKAQSWLKRTMKDAMIEEGKLEQLNAYI